MGVTNKGFPEHVKRLADFAAKRGTIFESCGNDLGNGFKRVVAKNTPTDTGELRRGWQVAPINMSLGGGDVTARVYNLTQYGLHVEYGHRIIIGGKAYGYVPGQYFKQRSERQYYPAMRARMSAAQKELNKLLGGGK